MALAHSLGARSTMAGRQWRQELEAPAGHIAPQSGNRAVNACSGSLSSFDLVRDPSPWVAAAHIQGGSFHISEANPNSLTDLPSGLSPGRVQSSTSISYHSHPDRDSVAF